jgi:uncharacterized protein involved in exopolysaccharide biosynthesis
MNRMTPKNQQQDEGFPELSLREILTPVFRHKRLVITVFCSVILLSILAAWLWASNYYVSTMQVLVQEDRSDPAITPGQNAAVQTGKPITADQITSEIALLQGRDILQAVVVNCGLTEHKLWSPSDLFLPLDPVRRKAAKEERATTGLAKALNVEAEKTSHVIDVKYGALGAPEKPACVLNNLSKLYLEKHLNLRRPTGSTAFFAEQTEKYKDALANDEAHLASFSRDEGVAVPDVIRTNMAQQVAISEANLLQAHQAISADQQRLRDLTGQLGKTPPRTLTEQTTNSANVLTDKLKAELLDAQLKRTQLLLKYEPTYPLVQEVDKEIQQTQEAIAAAEKTKYVNETTDRDTTFEFLREDLAKTQADLASQQATAAALTTGIQSMKMQMVDLDGKAVKQAALTRMAKADEANYLLYLDKREQERSADALDLRRITDVAIAVPAVVPSLPAHSPLLVLAIGFFLAIIFSVAAGSIAEYFDPSFRTPNEVADALGISVIASVPRRAA